MKFTKTIYPFICGMIVLVVIFALNFSNRWWIPPSENVVYGFDNKDKTYLHLNREIESFDLDHGTVEDAVKAFGEPKFYTWNSKVYNEKHLPDMCIAVFSDDFHIVIMNGKVNEIRIYETWFTLKNCIHVGSSLKDVQEIMGRPTTTSENVRNKIVEHRLYYKGQERNYRFFLVNYKVTAIYISGRSVEPSTEKAKTLSSQRVKTDRIDYPFEDDPSIIGTWKSVDFVDQVEDFIPEQRKWAGDLAINQVIFYKGGKCSLDRTWTKGIIISKADITASKYIIKKIQGRQYLFFEWKSRDYTFGGQAPFYYVLKKVYK